jgi:hypothetical protein
MSHSDTENAKTFFLRIFDSESPLAPQGRCQDRCVADSFQLKKTYV